jgi:carboxylate-amine ligase
MANRPGVEIRLELLQAARWRAARHGLGSNLIDVINQKSLPASQLVEMFLDYLHPVLQELGDWEEISSLVEHIF